MTNDEIAEGLFQNLGRGKLIGVIANQGPVPSFTLLFEDEGERRGQLTFQPSLLINAASGIVETRAQINISVNKFRK